MIYNDTLLYVNMILSKERGNQLKLTSSFYVRKAYGYGKGMGEIIL